MNESLGQPVEQLGCGGTVELEDQGWKQISKIPHESEELFRKGCNVVARSGFVGILQRSDGVVWSILRSIRGGAGLSTLVQANEFVSVDLQPVHLWEQRTTRLHWN